MGYCPFHGQAANEIGPQIFMQLLRLILLAVKAHFGTQRRNRTVPADPQSGFQLVVPTRPVSRATAAHEPMLLAAPRFTGCSQRSGLLWLRASGDQPKSPFYGPVGANFIGGSRSGFLLGCWILPVKRI
jgi:hypothetical protein